MMEELGYDVELTYKKKKRKSDTKIPQVGMVSLAKYYQ